MKWNNSKGRLNVGGIHLNDNPLRRKHRTSPSSKYIILIYLKMHFNSIWKKGRSYVSSARGCHWDGCNTHSVFPCCYFTSFEIITARATVFSLPLLLFHFIWNHNSKGLVSPPSRTIVLWKFHLFCKNLKYFRIYILFWSFFSPKFEFLKRKWKKWIK